MVLFKNNFEIKVENVYSDENGNNLILDFLTLDLLSLIYMVQMMINRFLMK
jgi:hypothetical protein